MDKLEDLFSTGDSQTGNPLINTELDFTLAMHPALPTSCAEIANLSGIHLPSNRANAKA